jgi:hypothetical protein
VHLVDEENDLSLEVVHVLEYRLEALLELASELGTSHKRTCSPRVSEPSSRTKTATIDQGSMK